MTISVRNGSLSLLVVVLLACLVLAGASAPAPPRTTAAGVLRAAQVSDIEFSNEAPVKGSLHGPLNPVYVVSVDYVDGLPGARFLGGFCYLDGMNLTSAGTFTNSSFTLYVGFAFRDGGHSVNIVVFDSYGFAAWDNWTFTVDTIPPFLIVTSPALPMVNVLLIPVQGTTFPALGVAAPVNVTVAAPASHFANWTLANRTSGTFTVWTPLSEGPNVLFVNATDAAGNTAADIVTIVSDTIRPALQILTPANLSVSPTNIVRVVGVSEFGAYLTVNGFSVIVAPNKTWSVDLALPDGPNVIVAAASDLVGNVNYTAVGILVDSDVPRITLASPLPSLTNRSSIDVSGYVSDTKVVALVARCGPILRPLAFDPTTGYFHTEFAGLPDATYPVEVTAVDAAQRSTVVGSDVVVDTTPPIVRLPSPPDGLETTQPTVQLNGTVNDPNATVLVNDQLVRPQGGRWQTTVALREGGNVVQISAIDEAGNRATPLLLHISYYSPYPDLANRTAANENDIAAVAGFARLSLVAIAVLAIGVELVLYSRTERKVRENRRMLAAALKALKKKPKAPGP